MQVERKKDNKMRITEQSPSYRDFAVKGKRLYRELMEFVKNSPQLKLLFVDSEKRKSAKFKEKSKKKLLSSKSEV
jgi:hypothetical protein